MSLFAVKAPISFRTDTGHQSTTLSSVSFSWLSLPTVNPEPAFLSSFFSPLVSYLSVNWISVTGQATLRLFAFHYQFNRLCPRWTASRLVPICTPTSATVMSAVDLWWHPLLQQESKLIVTLNSLLNRGRECLNMLRSVVITFVSYNWESSNTAERNMQVTMLGINVL